MSSVPLTVTCCAVIAIAGYIADHHGRSPSETATTSAAAAPSDSDGSAFLAKRVGNWAYAVRYEHRGALQFEAKGDAVFTSELEGKIVLARFNVDVSGQPASGLQMHSYNAAAKRFEATWAFSKSPAMTTLTGTASDDGKSVHYRGTEQSFPDRTTTTDAVVTMVDDDHFTVVMTRPDSQDGITVTETYTRKR